jgi:rod shape determining protein RodA
MGEFAGLDLRDQRTRGRPDYVLIMAVIVLSFVGLVMIYTASAPRLETEGLSRSSELVRQAIFVGGGLMVFALASLPSDRTWRLLSPYIYGASLLLLLAVLSPIGAVRQGAQRWIPFGIMDFQPAEFAKPAVILGLALLLASAQENEMRWVRIARAIGLVAAPSVLIFLQPDLGTMLVFGFVLVVMLFVAGTTIRQLLVIAVASVVLLIAAFQLDVLEEYQLNRIAGFLNAGEQTLTVNYNQNQSQIAIGSGGLFGLGLGEGSQTNLAFVPAQTTDFIFTAVGEQLGFLGAVVVLGLFFLVVWRLLVIAANARDRWGTLVVTGVAAMIGFHVFVNVGMAIGLLPVTGLPLPLMSFGGSFYGSIMLSLGISQSIWFRRSRVPGERHLL